MAQPISPIAWRDNSWQLYVARKTSSCNGGLGMHKQLAWHRRHALMLASQLPEDPQEARMVLEALREIVERYLIQDEDEVPGKTSNVLPFASG
jgi:hypothetical protein